MHSRIVFRDSIYFRWGIRIYNWTKTSLQDSADYLYFDNKDLAGKTDTRKYTYNSGQMLQPAAILYRLTGDESYLREAQQIGGSVINHFTEDFTTVEGKKIRQVWRRYGQCWPVSASDRERKLAQLQSPFRGLTKQS